MTLSSSRRVAIYARVSTTEQTTENQLFELRAYIDTRDWKLTREYVDEGVSGSKDRRAALALYLIPVELRIASVPSAGQTLLAGT